MCKIILFSLLIAGLCFGQKEQRNFISSIQKNGDNKKLSLEIMGSMYFTFEHYIKFGGAKLPFYMWGGSWCISYQISPHRALSCAGGYSYTKDLRYPTVYFGLSAMEFSNRNFAFLFSYKETNITIGAGIDVSNITVSRADWSPDSTIVYSSTANTIFVRPIVSVSAQSNIIYSLHLKIQMEGRILPFVKIGSKEVHLPQVQPGMGIGLEYVFNL